MNGARRLEVSSPALHTELLAILKHILIKQRRIQQLKARNLHREESTLFAPEYVATSHGTDRILDNGATRIFKPLPWIEDGLLSHHTGPSDLTGLLIC